MNTDVKEQAVELEVDALGEGLGETSTEITADDLEAAKDKALGNGSEEVDEETKDENWTNPLVDYPNNLHPKDHKPLVKGDETVEELRALRMDCMQKVAEMYNNWNAPLFVIDPELSDIEKAGYEVMVKKALSAINRYVEDKNTKVSPKTAEHFVNFANWYKSMAKAEVYTITSETWISITNIVGGEPITGGLKMAEAITHLANAFQRVGTAILYRDQAAKYWELQVGLIEAKIESILNPEPEEEPEDEAETEPETGSDEGAPEPEKEDVAKAKEK